MYIHNNMIVTMRTEKETEMQISRIPTRVFLILCCRIVQGKKWIFGINPCTINCSCEVVCVSYITQLFQTKFGLSRETREKGNVTGWRERGGVSSGLRISDDFMFLQSIASILIILYCEH